MGTSGKELTTKIFDKSDIELIKNTVAKGTTDNELKLFIKVCENTGLNPFAKQIHAIKRGDIMLIQTGIDGYRLIADRTGKYGGSDDYLFEDNLNLYQHLKKSNGNPPLTATATVYKIIAGQRVSFTATASWQQYFPGEKQGFIWKKMPHLMLGKCAESLALRKAFPAELSGLYTKEELDQANKIEPEKELKQANIDKTLLTEIKRLANSLTKYKTKGQIKQQIVNITSNQAYSGFTDWNIIDPQDYKQIIKELQQWLDSLEGEPPDKEEKSTAEEKFGDETPAEESNTEGSKAASGSSKNKQLPKEIQEFCKKFNIKDNSNLLKELCEEFDVMDVSMIGENALLGWLSQKEFKIVQ